VEEERKLNHTSLLGLTGLYGDDSSGSTSLFEMLYSYRRSKDLYYPDLRSQEAVDALKMYKKIYNIASSGYDKIFGTIGKGESLFIKYWAFEDTYPLYKLSTLPGWKEGISTSILGGIDIGISTHIVEERKQAAAKVLEFFLSREEQKRLVIHKKILTGIRELYEDEEVCEVMDCDLYRNLQLNPRYHYERRDFDDYSDKFRRYAYEFVLGNKTAEEILERINDIIYIHQITLDGEETWYGLVLFIVIIVLSVFFIGSSLFFYIERLKPTFKFLPLDFWYIILLGILCHTVSSFTEYGEVLPYKCRLKVLLYSMGYTLTFVPILYKLITNFPIVNKFSKWTSKNRYLFLLSIVILDVVLNLINLGSSFGTKTIQTANGKKYHECKMDVLAKIVVYASFGYKAIIILNVGFLSFMEWNIKETIFDVHISILTIYINILSVVMMGVLKLIEFNYYITYCIFNKLFILIIVLSNYIGLIGLRVVIGFISKDKEEPFNIIDNLKLFQSSTSISFSTQKSEKSEKYEKSSIAKSRNSSRYQKAISFHYLTSIPSS